MSTRQSALAALRGQLREYYRDLASDEFDPARPHVRLHESTYGFEETWAALESLLTTHVTMGEKVRRFESEFARSMAMPHAAMVNSGSSANLLAVAALTNPALPARLRPGDEVIVPALAWSTTVWPLIQHGLVPVIVDIDPQTMNIDLNEVVHAITPKTRGLMVVHVYGNPCDGAALQRLARQHHLVLIEDCCEALGATFEGKPVGSFGDVATFSFYFSHHITTLEGGMCVTADPALDDLLRILRAHGWVREVKDQAKYLNAHPTIHPRFLFVNVGYNVRPTELQGGFGSEQLKRLAGFVQVRTRNARFWRSALAPCEDVFTFQEPTVRGEHSWFGFPMTVRESAPFTTKELTAFLNERGIETRPIIAGNIAAQPALQYYAHRTVGALPHANHVMVHGFTFGNHQQINEDARTYVVDTINMFLKGRGMN